MRKTFRMVLAGLMLALFTVLCMLPVAAAEETGSGAQQGWKKTGGQYCYYISGEKVTGWKKIDGKVYYFRPQKEDRNPAGSMVTGFYKIGKRTFYFNSNGTLQLGWASIEGKYYYFSKTGRAGVYGAMKTGFQKIGGELFWFGDDGVVKVGWGTYKGKKYFFSNSKKMEVRGRAITGVKKISGVTYYFSEDGSLLTDCWIDEKYYLDSNGKILKSAVTPDGYVVNSKGVKVRVAKGWIRVDGKYYYYVKGKKTTNTFKTIDGKKYYFDADGVRQNGWITVGGAKYYLKKNVVQTGLQTIKGKDYYFKKNGKLAVNTKIDGYIVDENGIATKDPENETETETESQAGKGKKILIIAGHGQGDSGAVATYGSTTYYEYRYTREFANLIFKNLKDSNLSVTMYNQNYDCYQVVAGRKSGPAPNFNKYDYVLEIHFNATVVSGKDLGGDGNYKGVGMYVNSAKKDITLDRQIVAAINKTGFRIWGGSTGIFRSSGLLNCRTCQGKGVSYGLLETAFIDDRDDMKFYNSNKEKMAEAVASAIVSYFSK